MRPIYLASPLGFAESARAFLIDLVTRLREHVDIHNPWEASEATASFPEIMMLETVSERDGGWPRSTAHSGG